MIKISSDEAVEFIVESNKIEEILTFPKDVELCWKGNFVGDYECSGQVNALKYLMTLPITKKLTKQNILKVHRLLMTGLLPESQQGFRHLNVRVGYRICPPYYQIPLLVGQWLENVNQLKNPTEDDIWQTHLAYEWVHPFIDGNGRSGRLLWLWLRYKFGFGYKCIMNSTKFADYYPQFDMFNWRIWDDSFPH